MAFGVKVAARRSPAFGTSLLRNWKARSAVHVALASLAVREVVWALLTSTCRHHRPHSEASAREKQKRKRRHCRTRRDVSNREKCKGPRPERGKGPRPERQKGPRPERQKGPRPERQKGPRPERGIGPCPERGEGEGPGPEQGKGPHPNELDYPRQSFQTLHGHSRPNECRQA
eukprot:1688713-Pleurochrysis_carterae.AAC.1